MANEIANPFELNSQFAYGGTAYLYTADDANNVYATLDMPYQTQAYPVFTTKRYENGVWVNIESIRGPLAWSDASYKHDSSVAFNGYAYKGTTIAIQVDLYNNSDYTDLMEDASSRGWLR